jgi:hypothetical protein
LCRHFAAVPWLRDYGIPPRTWADGSTCCFGLEPSIEPYVAHTVEVCRAIRRVLRDDGVMWWNLGDSMNQYNSGRTDSVGRLEGRRNVAHAAADRGLSDERLKVGDIMGVPWRVALALQADGWYWRDTVIWHKPSPMPSSQNGVRWERCRVKVGRAPRAVANSYHHESTNGKPHGERDGKLFASTSKWAPCPGCKNCEPNGGWVLRRGRWRTTTAHEPVFLFAKSHGYFSMRRRQGKLPSADSQGIRRTKGMTLTPTATNIIGQRWGW